MELGPAIHQAAVAASADLALALWESLEEPDREAALALTAEQAAEFDRRLAEHRADPTSAIPWEEVRKKFGKP